VSHHSPCEAGFPSPVALATLLTLWLRFIYSAIGAVLAPGLTRAPVLVYASKLEHNLSQPAAGLRHSLWGVWERYDTLWYVEIAKYGYQRPDSVVFFPVYPLLLRLASKVVGQPSAAALLLSTVSAFFLFWGFQKLLRLDLPVEVVNKAVVLYAVWPASFIFFAGYPDSLLAALMVWSVYFARAGRWGWAGVFGCLAGLTKAVGVLVLVPLALLAWRARHWRVLPVGLCLLAPLAFALFLKASGAPLAPEVYPKYWYTDFAFPWQTLGESFRRVILCPDLLLTANLIALLVVAGVTLTKGLRLEYTLFAVSILCLFLAKKTVPLLQSTMRYVLAVFPAYASLACYLKSDLAFAAGVLASFALNLVLLALFLAWTLVV
jgi:hypothetical protein